MTFLLKTIPVIILNVLIAANEGEYSHTFADGKELYAKHCLTCHQADGSGVPGMFPPLIKTDKVLGPADTLINILICGLKGPIEVAGQAYEQEMPGVAYLTNEEIAAILTYVRSSFGNDKPPVKPEDVAKVRSKPVLSGGG